MTTQLTALQWSFCAHYARTNDRVASYIAAGGSPSSASTESARLLKRTDILEEIERRRNKLDATAELDRARFAEELAAVALAKISDVLAWSTVRGQKPKVTLTDSANLDPATAAAIAEITHRKDGSVHVKMHNKLTAISQLTDLMGWMPARQRADDAGTEDQDPAQLAPPERTAQALLSALSEIARERQTAPITIDADDAEWS